MAVITFRFMEKHILILSKAQVGREARSTLLDSLAFFVGPDQEQSHSTILLKTYHIWHLLIVSSPSLRMVAQFNSKKMEDTKELGD